MGATTRAEGFHPAAGAVTHVPGRAAIATAIRRLTRSAGRHVGCLLLGHEKWVALTGDWACMRCGKLRRAEIERFPRVARDPWTELPAFDAGER